MLTTPPKKNCGLDIISKNSIVAAHSVNDFTCFGINNKSAALKIPREPEKINNIKDNWITVKEINR